MLRGIFLCPLKVFSSVLRDRVEQKSYKTFALVFEVCAVSWEQGGIREHGVTVGF